LYALDGLRALAVTTVIMRHYAQSHFYGGFLGVDLFFVLSGFLITRLLVQEYQASGRVRFDLFYLRRACRILPAIVGTLVFVTLLRTLMPQTFDAPLSWWFSDIAVLFSFANFVSDSLNSVGHTWSLSVEEQFYFLWPMTLLVILHRCRSVAGMVVATVSLALAGAVLRAWMFSQGGYGLNVYFFLFTRMDSLLLGAAVALAEGLPNMREKWAHFCRYRPAEIVMALFAVAIVVLSDHRMFYMYYGGLTFMAFLFAVLIGSVSFDPRRTVLKQVLESQPMVWIGRRSYGIYLYHLPVFYLLQPLHQKFPGTLGNLAYTAAGIVVPVTLAALSYHYIEIPFLKLKGHLKWNFAKADGEASEGKQVAASA
jgi:peptidoglycan/LPS O-acetylase OafA/YrhL